MDDLASLTGERTWPGIERENYWFMRHLACYQWAAERVATYATVGPLLDAGSGEGYGADVAATTCNRVVMAVELDASMAAHAGNRYPHLVPVRANLVALPFRDRAFAAAISLQVVEHIWDPVTYMRELARCTCGPVVISTPNRTVHSPGLGPGERPDNPFHVREFDAHELVALMTDASTDRTPEVYGVQHGERIRAWERMHGSMPALLLDSPEDSGTAAIAGTVQADDFVITSLDVDDPGPDVYDLVAIW